MVDKKQNISIIVNGKAILNNRLKDANHLFTAKIWGMEVDLYFTDHALKNAKIRWVSTKELFVQECLEILDNDNLDFELMSVGSGVPISLLDEESGKIIWFRQQFNDKAKRMEIYIHSVFRYIPGNIVFVGSEDFCVKILSKKDVVVGIENIPEFQSSNSREK